MVKVRGSRVSCAMYTDALMLEYNSFRVHTGRQQYTGRDPQPWHVGYRTSMSFASTGRGVTDKRKQTSSLASSRPLMNVPLVL